MYLILLLLLGIPLMYMEMVIGQWLRMDNIQAWKYLVPWLSGVGYSSMLVGVGWQSHKSPVSSLLHDPSNPPSPPQACVLVILYNSALASWSLFYLGQSFDYPLSWEHCPLVENFSITSEERDRGMQELEETPCEPACKYVNLSALLRLLLPLGRAPSVLLVSHCPPSLQSTRRRDRGSGPECDPVPLCHMDLPLCHHGHQDKDFSASKCPNGHLLPGQKSHKGGHTHFREAV